MNWLPVCEDWLQRFDEVKLLQSSDVIPALRALAGARLNYAQVSKLDRAITRTLKDPDVYAGLPRLKLAVLGSATTSHLAPGIRVAALRRGLIVEIYEGSYGLYLQELLDTSSALHAFRPDVLLLSLDAHHLAETAGATAESALGLMEKCWALAAQHLKCTVIQQTVMPVFEPILGNNEQRFGRSPAALVDRLNAELRPRADAAGVHLLALDSFVRTLGLAEWYEPALWHKSKHEVHPRASVMYGDQVARLLAALRGASSKCLVLDLDNTLWGGVIGDDGLEGIVLGQGNAVGEAYLGFQRYCALLASRGVILAVCSKNDEKNARLPFQKHPEMVLRESDIACLVANWQDKATNLRSIAATLNIGIDSLVFADDNPAERALIRQELPSVQVPEMPEDPALYTHTIAQAGYFEALRITAEDEERGRQYQANAERARMKEEVTDIESYLTSLDMQFTAQPFEPASLARVTQLINKTNQFNLTTRRYTEAEVHHVMDDPSVITVQVRLTDKFGDNGTIAILIVRIDERGQGLIDTWLMSCRVLGRRVEEACLNCLVTASLRNDVTRLIGVYRPTEKNSMVRELYMRLGFEPLEDSFEAGEQRYVLDLTSYQERPVPMAVHDLLAFADAAQLQT